MAARVARWDRTNHGVCWGGAHLRAQLHHPLQVRQRDPVGIVLDADGDVLAVFAHEHIQTNSRHAALGPSLVLVLAHQGHQRVVDKLAHEISDSVVARFVVVVCAQYVGVGGGVDVHLVASLRLIAVVLRVSFNENLYDLPGL